MRGVAARTHENALVSLGQPADLLVEAERAGRLQRLLHIFGPVGHRDVVEDRALKDDGPLVEIDDPAAPAPQRMVRRRRPVDPDLARTRALFGQDEAQERRLTGAVVARDDEPPAGRNAEGDTFEKRPVRTAAPYRQASRLDLASEASLRQGPAPFQPAVASEDLSSAGGVERPAEPERPGEEEPRDGSAEPPDEPIGESEDQDPDGEEPAGEGGADSLVGDAGNNSFDGGEGDDVIESGEGADTIDASAVTEAMTLTVSADGEGTLSTGGVEGGPALADGVIETPGAQFEVFLLGRTAWTDPQGFFKPDSEKGDAEPGDMIAFNGYSGAKVGIDDERLSDGSRLAAPIMIDRQSFGAGVEIDFEYGFIVEDQHGLQYFVGKVALGNDASYDGSVISAGWDPVAGEWVDPPAPGTVLTLPSTYEASVEPWKGDHDTGRISDHDFDPFSDDIQIGEGVNGPVVESATSAAEPVMSASFQSVEAFRLGGGDDVADASAATVNLVIEGGGGSDTILCGSGNDLIDAGDGRIDSVEGAGVRSTTFSVFRLGNYGDIDPNESNGASETAASMLGTYGSADNPLFLHLTRATGNDANGNGRIEDNDRNRAGAEVETYTIDGQTVKLDSGQA